MCHILDCLEDTTGVALAHSSGSRARRLETGARLQVPVQGRLSSDRGLFSRR